MVWLAGVAGGTFGLIVGLVGFFALPFFLEPYPFIFLLGLLRFGFVFLSLVFVQVAVGFVFLRRGKAF
jgi:hypothetical protein